ncbi:MAG: hypothetical protein ACXVE9_17350 [Solirubrobacteraceae bacterium]
MGGASFDLMPRAVDAGEVAAEPVVGGDRGHLRELLERWKFRPVGRLAVTGLTGLLELLTPALMQIRAQIAAKMSVTPSKIHSMVMTRRFSVRCPESAHHASGREQLPVGLPFRDLVRMAPGC